MDRRNFPFCTLAFIGTKWVVSGMVYLPLDHVVQPSELAQDEVWHLMVLPRPHTTGSGNEEWE